MLSEERILNADHTPYQGVPFNKAPVIGGVVHQDQFAVIVNRQEIWKLSEGKWLQLITTDKKLNCLAWTSDDKLW